MFGKKRIYLDYAAGGSGNPSSPHEEGRQAKSVLEDARRTIARLLEVQQDDVVFTSGATEGNALALIGTARALKAQGKERIHILYLPSAHASIVSNARSLRAWGVEVDELPIQDARVHIDALKGMLTAETALISMEAVCGETGVVWNTREVSHAIENHPCVLHVDASQAPLTQNLTRAHYGADILTLDVSKVSSVRGIGAFVAHRTLPVAPLYEGGGQERGLRPGTEAPELAHAFVQALQAAAKNREAFVTQSNVFRSFLISELSRAIPTLLINEGREQAPNILNISLPGKDTDYLIALLNEQGFAVSTRSACETDSEEGSRAVFALTKDTTRALSTLRVSWGADRRERDIRLFLHALKDVVSFIDSSANA
jgi:cysteine desulfurase